MFRVGSLRDNVVIATELPNHRPGGFRDALAMVKQPMLSSFSSHDFALHDTFHLALRRGKDLGEVEIAEAPGQRSDDRGPVTSPRGFESGAQAVLFSSAPIAASMSADCVPGTAGRTSTEPVSTSGILAAHSIAASRSGTSMR